MIKTQILTHTAGGDRNDNTQAWEQMGQCLCKHSFINLVQCLIQFTLKCVAVVKLCPPLVATTYEQN